MHGYIDWSWKGRDIEAFANTFDGPDQGASTFLDAERVRLKGCYLTDEDLDFHPFQAGSIVRSYDDHVFVAACDGLLRFSQILKKTARRRSIKFTWADVSTERASAGGQPEFSCYPERDHRKNKIGSSYD